MDFARCYPKPFLRQIHGNDPSRDYGRSNIAVKNDVLDGDRPLQCNAAHERAVQYLPALFGRIEPQCCGNVVAERDGHIVAAVKIHPYATLGRIQGKRNGN
jgi:hypothetical protein